MCILYYRPLIEYKLFIELYNVRINHSDFLRKNFFTLNHNFKFYRSQLHICHYCHSNYYLIIEFHKCVLQFCILNQGKVVERMPFDNKQ